MLLNKLYTLVFLFNPLRMSVGYEIIPTEVASVDEEVRERLVELAAAPPLENPHVDLTNSHRVTSMAIRGLSTKRHALTTAVEGAPVIKKSTGAIVGVDAVEDERNRKMMMLETSTGGALTSAVADDIIYVFRVCTTNMTEKKPITVPLLFLKDIEYFHELERSLNLNGTFAFLREGKRLDKVQNVAVLALIQVALPNMLILHTDPLIVNRENELRDQLVYFMNEYTIFDDVYIESIAILSAIPSSDPIFTVVKRLQEQCFENLIKVLVGKINSKIALCRAFPQYQEMNKNVIQINFSINYREWERIDTKQNFAKNHVDYMVLRTLDTSDQTFVKNKLYERGLYDLYEYASILSEYQAYLLVNNG